MPQHTAATLNRGPRPHLYFLRQAHQRRVSRARLRRANGFSPKPGRASLHPSSSFSSSMLMMAIDTCNKRNRPSKGTISFLHHHTPRFSRRRPRVAQRPCCKKHPTRREQLYGVSCIPERSRGLVCWGPNFSEMFCALFGGFHSC